MGDVARLDFESVELSDDSEHDRERDHCALATELAIDDVCSLLCEPDAFAARLVEGGTPTGRCYQWRCELVDGVAVNVGICLP